MNKNYAVLTKEREKRAKAIFAAGGIEKALEKKAIEQFADITLSEAIVLGFLRQNVKKFITTFGHGSTEVGEVLRVYEEAGLVNTYGVRSEIEASHAAMALRWITGEKAAVITSIGPGALQALAASIVPISNGVGVWYLFGDETTEDEGLNFQQIPKAEQNLFLQLTRTMGQAYTLHTAESIGSAFRRGINVVDHPHRAGAFFLLMPMNIQCKKMSSFNINELPVGAPPSLGTTSDKETLDKIVEILSDAKKTVVRVGGGAKFAGKELAEFLQLTDSVAVTSPVASGVIPYNDPRNMTMAGSKGSLSGNYAMDDADTLVVLGARFACQSDCSRTAYPKVQHVININAEIEPAMHYNKTTAVLGEIGLTLSVINKELKKRKINKSAKPSEWAKACAQKKKEWDAFKAERYTKSVLLDEVWKREVMTQPAVIKAATDWARKNKAVSLFDAGDVQANGFQIVEDEKIGQTFTDTGASYMGFSVSALLATGIASKKFYGLAFTGDGSFSMNPTILIDGVQHGAQGCILLLDNRRMGAISSLQHAQFGDKFDHATNDSVEVDYVAWAKSVKGVQAFHGGYSVRELISALDKAKAHKGLSLIHVPVYFGSNPLGGFGAFGRWNVGNWCEDVQKLRHKIGL
ncbi:MAG: thiamine pyrophosphate-dependent enzyme [Lentisphaerota bacterium]